MIAFCSRVMVTITWAAATTSGWRAMAVEAIASSASSMPSSRRASRASSDGIMPSRAHVATPPEHTRTSPTPRTTSIRSRSICAITLRAVLA